MPAGSNALRIRRARHPAAAARIAALEQLAEAIIATFTRRDDGYRARDGG